MQRRKRKKKKSEKAKSGIGLLTQIPILVRRTILIESGEDLSKPDELDEEEEEKPKKQTGKKA